MGWLGGLLRSQEQVEADQLADQVHERGAESIASCERGRHVRVCGTVRSVTLRPKERQPTFEAEVFDGTGHLTLVWLGRRSLAGVEVGRMIEARGRVTCPRNHPIIFNPDYELRPVGAE
ncbi:MAG: OB-fold nucleic acid binding domain-containing protein [Actinomycetota bacterium]